MENPQPETVLQILTPDGLILRGKGQAKEEHEGSFLKDLYVDMLMTRRLDLEATALQRSGELGLFPPALGQEAAQVGSARAAEIEDYVFPSYREHGVLLVRGVDPVGMLSIFRGTTLGGWDPKRTNTHLYTFVVGAHALHAVGYAMGNKLSKNGAAVLAYFGDGATAQGDINEALVFATANAAPVVFFVQNNQWAISTRTSEQIKGSIATRARGFGMPALKVDGNDVLACYNATRWALGKARKGEGPVLLEAETFRMGAHTTSDDPTRYRTKQEELQWAGRDPIERMRKLLRRKGLLTSTFDEEIEETLEAFGQRIRQEVKALKAPDVESMFNNVYARGNKTPEEFKSFQTDWQLTGEGDR